MRSSFFKSATLASYCLSQLAAVSAEPLKFDFTRERRVLNYLDKRADPINVGLPNAEVEYLIGIAVGTPPQNISLQIDTGSSNVWFPSSESSLCQNAGCAPSQAFDPNQSSSFRSLSNGTFAVTYGVGQAAGDFISDTLSLGPAATLTNFTMGLGTNFSATTRNGILGIGFDNAEAVAPNATTPFPGLLTSLQQAGLVQRRAYSIYLNDPEAKGGSILFGGLDTAKFTGELVAVPITPFPNGRFLSLRIDMTSISFTDDSGNSSVLTFANTSSPAVLDTGSTATNLPVEVTRAIVRGTGAVLFNGFYLVDCTIRNSNASVVFQFGGSNGPKINVPMRSMIGEPTGATFSNGQPACTLLIDEEDLAEDLFYFAGGAYVLGDAFLRSAYVLFDLDNNEIYLAQAALNKLGEEKIQEIPAGSGLPGVTSTATATATVITTIPASVLSQITGTARVGQSASFITGAEAVPTTPASPVFNVAAVSANSATGSAASATSSSTSANSAAAVFNFGRWFQLIAFLSTGLLLLIGA